MWSTNVTLDTSMYNFHHKTLEMKKYTDKGTRVCYYDHSDIIITCLQMQRESRSGSNERSKKKAGIT